MGPSRVACLSRVDISNTPKASKQNAYTNHACRIFVVRMKRAQKW